MIENICNDRLWFQDTFYTASAMLEQKYIRIRAVCTGGEQSSIKAEDYISALFEYLPLSALKKECVDKKPSFNFIVEDMASL